jgi:hypothetical protein
VRSRRGFSTAFGAFAEDLHTNRTKHENMKKSLGWKHQFEPRDFLNVRPLVAKLLSPPDEPVRQVARLISPEILTRLKGAGDAPGEEKQLIALLVTEFNRLISGPVLLDEATRQQMKLRPG